GDFMKDFGTSVRICREVRAVVIIAVSAAIPMAGFGQAAESLDVTGKLEYHVKCAVGPAAILGDVAYAAVLQADNAPLEWKQGGEAFRKRVASMEDWPGIQTGLAFGLDSTLHQDPRYYRAGGPGFWRRSAHALRGTLLTRNDSGGETLSTWRIGSAYGSGALFKNWVPGRLYNGPLPFIQGSVTLGFDLIGN